MYVTGWSVWLQILRQTVSEASCQLQLPDGSINFNFDVLTIESVHRELTNHRTVAKWRHERQTQSVTSLSAADAALPGRRQTVKRSRKLTKESEFRKRRRSYTKKRKGLSVRNKQSLDSVLRQPLPRFHNKQGFISKNIAPKVAVSPLSKSRDLLQCIASRWRHKSTANQKRRR